MAIRPERNFSDEVSRPFRLAGGRHGVLLLHGFTGTAAHMRPLGETLHRCGFTVEGINLPGHGLSMAEMKKSTWEDWLNAAKDAFLRLKADCDHISIAGLSMGGCLALILAEQMQPTAIAPISAPMGTKAPLWLTRMAAPFMPTVYWRTRENDPSPIDERYDYGYPGFPTSRGAHLNRLIRMARRDLHAVSCPILIVQSHADATIAPNSARIMLDGVSSARKGVLWLEDVPHVCTLSKESANIAAAIAEHFRWAEQQEG